MKHVLVIGSSIIDLFVHLHDASQAQVKDETVSLHLGDKVPIDIDTLTLGGNGSNVSVGLSRLELQTTFYTYLGKDLFSREIEEKIGKEQLHMIIEHGNETRTSLALIFNFDTDRIIFDHHVKRPHKFVYPGQTPQFMYLTSIGEVWQEAYKQALLYSHANHIPLAFSPGSHQLHEMADPFSEVLAGSTFLFVNREEAEKILKKVNKESGEIPVMMKNLQSLGPQVVSITDGDKGSYAKAENGPVYFLEPTKMDITEKTGAGDSYATGFFAAYIMSHKIPECMRWGIANAASVMTKIGAQDGLLTLAAMQKWLEENKDTEAHEFT